MRASDIFARDPQFGGTPIHEWKAALVTIKNFRPMLSRVPLGPKIQGMSTNAHLVLEVDVIDVKGAFGEDVWGKPVDVELHPDIKLWVEGLRVSGGDGCVLYVDYVLEYNLAFVIGTF